MVLLRDGLQEGLQPVDQATAAGVDLSHSLQLVTRIHLHRFQERQTVRVPTRRLHQQGLHLQADQDARHRPRIDILARADSRGTLHRETAPEYRQSPEHGLLVRAQ